MPTHKLDLLENAIDSFNEALRKYQDGLANDPKAYKFAILHFSHFLELLFKYYVAQSHPLLIYKNPFSKSIEKESTIGLWEAVQFLKNEGNDISTTFYQDLEWLKRLRNNIEHYRFEMDIPEARRTIGRLTQAMNEFNSNFSDFDLTDHVEPANLQIFEELADEYRAQLAHSRVEAKEQSEDGEGHYCTYCGNEETAALVMGTYICKFCEEEDSETNCCICGEPIRISDAITWNDEHAPHIDYVCEACDYRIRNMN